MHLITAVILAAATMLGPKLVDQTGHAFTLGSLRGSPVALTFVSAHCTDACPLINAQFARACLSARRCTRFYSVQTA